MKSKRTLSCNMGFDSLARVEQYLFACVMHGRQYFCADEISRVLGLSAQIVGSQLSKLKKESKLLDIAIWSHSSHTIWKFSLKPLDSLVSSVPVQQKNVEEPSLRLTE